MSLDNKKDLSAVRLSTLSVDVRNKLAKFDASNEGELTIEDLMHAVVTLQKQSNNYKRLLYIILPIMIIMIASIFGTTILAINLTRDVKTSSQGHLVSTNTNAVVATSEAFEYSTFQEWISSDNPEDLRSVKALEFQNMIVPVSAVFVSENSTSIASEYFYLIVDRFNGTIDVEIKTMYKDDFTAQAMVKNLEDQMGGKSVKYMSFDSTSNQSGKWNIFNFFGLFSVQKTPPAPAGAVKPGCGPTGICKSL